MDSNVRKILFESIRSNDKLIGFFAAAAVILFLAVIISHLMLNNEVNAKNVVPKNFWFFKFVYTLFVTIISLFPLLGMLGTVNGLLGLDLANGDMENIKVNFFAALTSTAWGIIFSVIFKILHAFQVDKCEDLLDKVKSLRDTK